VRVALLSPPGGSITHPQLSLPSLTAHLRSLGHDVLQCDVGARALDAMLTSHYLQQLHQVVRRLIEAGGARHLPTRLRSKQLCCLLAADLYAEDLIGAIEEAKMTLRSNDLFYHQDRYRYACNLVRRAFDMISAAHFPTTLAHNRIDYGLPLTYDAVIALTEDGSRNPFLKLLRDRLVQEILPDVPRVVGISITYNSQLVSGFTLARIVKTKHPSTHIVMGGASITAAEPRLRAHARAFDWVDSYVFGEGEGALAGLLAIIEADHSLPNCHSRLFMRSDRRRAAISDRGERDPLNDLPCPDYVGLNLHDYLAPETVFLLSSARGCYYRKCAFCTVSLPFCNGFQERRRDLLARDLRLLQRKHNARAFFFADDCVPPRRCQEISELARSLDAPIIWQTEVRFEWAFTKRLLTQMRGAGCRQLIFGNESASQRVLDLMRKGTEVRKNADIIRDAFAAGIAVHLQNFLGFPGETSEEAQETVELLVRHRASITSWALTSFKLQEFSPVHNNPQAFGVCNMRRRRVDELDPTFAFSTSSGATRKVVTRLVKDATSRLNWIYPSHGVFLDGVYGAHALLFFARTGKQKMEDIFALPTYRGDILQQQPRMGAAVKSRQLGRTRTALYNPVNGELAFVSSRLTRWLPRAHAEASSAKLLAGYPGAGNSGSRGGAADTAAVLGLLALSLTDLYRYGFVELR
jgi:anaerobic magnesium-protoporphyrin IX monomethyl ester cyclase